MEFIQFHPTTFHMEGAPNFLISEAVRGEGARLVLANGEPFMQRHAPEWKDLAPRDVVARSIHREMFCARPDSRLPGPAFLHPQGEDPEPFPDDP